MVDGIVPHFTQLLGQEELVKHFATQQKEERLPHALLLVGEDGSEAMPLALALTRLILCEETDGGGMPCGKCPSCKMIDKLEHPDLTLVYPVVRIDDQTTSQDYFKQFQKLVASHQRFTEMEWREMQDAKNKQLQIMVAEAERLLKTTSLRSFKSKHQVILMWMPEMMRTETSNKLLKLLEEPPTGVIFILVSHQPQKLLPTIVSRTQRVNVPSISEQVLVDYLMKEKKLSDQQAKEYGHLAKGNLYKALAYSSGDSSELQQKREALELMLLPRERDPKLFLERSKELASMNRPDVISLLDTIPEIIREAMAMRFGDDTVVYLPEELKKGCRVISKLLDHTAISELMEDIIAAKNEVRQNSNIRIVFFDLLLNIAMLYSRRA